jgi:hypothetical protein
MNPAMKALDVSLSVVGVVAFVIMSALATIVIAAVVMEIAKKVRRWAGAVRAQECIDFVMEEPICRAQREKQENFRG